MKLKKALKVVKAKRFQVFVYPSGHVKYCRGINECSVAMFEFSRSYDGTIPFNEDIEKYKNLKVVEIIPYVSSVGIVVELNNQSKRLRASAEGCPLRTDETGRNNSYMKVGGRMTEDICKTLILGLMDRRQMLESRMLDADIAGKSVDDVPFLKEELEHVEKAFIYLSVMLNERTLW